MAGLEKVGRRRGPRRWEQGAAEAQGCGVRASPPVAGRVAEVGEGLCVAQKDGGDAGVGGWVERRGPRGGSRPRDIGGGRRQRGEIERRRQQVNLLWCYSAQDGEGMRPSGLGSADERTNRFVAFSMLYGNRWEGIPVKVEVGSCSRCKKQRNRGFSIAVCFCEALHRSHS